MVNPNSAPSAANAAAGFEAQQTSEAHAAADVAATLDRPGLGREARPLDIYLLGICGTGVGALAGFLQRLGHNVRGSDEHVYPPMSDALRQWGIEVLHGYDPAHLEPTPDLVVVGNVIRRHNPEAEYVRQNGIPHISMPEAVARFGIGDKHSVVVAGTHGKTTTTALIAHALMDAGRDPSFLVGGVLRDYPESFRAGGGDEFVVEGDEYDTAYFDKGPKFLHYKPRTAVLTSLEFDHADIYDSVEQIEAAFGRLIETVAPDGHLVVAHQAERALRLARQRAGERTLTVYASRPVADADLVATRWQSAADGVRVDVAYRGVDLGRFHVPMWGDYSVQNTLAAIGVLLGIGLEPERIRHALGRFAGVRRRMDVLGEPAGVTVVDDFGHHPTAVRETLAAARTRWRNRRVWAIFEPRSATTRRNIFQDAFESAFAAADRVVLGSHARLNEIPEAERFSPAAVATALRQHGVLADYVPRVDAIVDLVDAEAKAGDVILVFSNGAFGGLHQKLLRRLEQRPVNDH